MNQILWQYVALTAIIVSISGCAADGDLCLLGRSAYDSQRTDYNRPVLVDKNNVKLSSSDQKKVTQQGRAYAKNIINQNYDLVKELCIHHDLTGEQSQKIIDISYIYTESKAAPWLEWNDKKQLYTSGLYSALDEQNLDKVITENLCVIGLCNKKDIEQFCTAKQRPYLNKKSLIDPLMKHYIRNKDISITYPYNEKVTYTCKQPKLLFP